MVRRLTQHFLTWLRQTLAQLRGEKNRRRTSLPTKQLPSTVKQREPIPSSQQLPSPPQTEQQLTASSSHWTSPPQASPPPAPNPAAHRAEHLSNFEILLSNYQYSPSSAIQSLSNQLANSDVQNSSTAETFQSSRHSGHTVIVNNNLIQDYSTQSQSIEKAHKQSLHPDSKKNLKPAIPNVSEVYKRDDNNAKTHLRQPLPSPNPDEKLTIDQLPEPVSHSPKPIPINTSSEPEVITKQGVVKLLFKLKKNNYHGYIAPDDGSKDIIFHQKYIGDNVFSQLERGIAVEVTAHVTEGKAYADHVRIL